MRAAIEGSLSLTVVGSLDAKRIERGGEGIVDRERAGKGVRGGSGSSVRG